MRKQRKHYPAEEKVAVLRRHLVDNEPVSKLCDELAPWTRGFQLFLRIGKGPLVGDS